MDDKFYFGNMWQARLDIRKRTIFAVLERGAESVLWGPAEQESEKKSSPRGLNHQSEKNFQIQSNLHWSNRKLLWRNFFAFYFCSKPALKIQRKDAITRNYIKLLQFFLFISKLGSEDSIKIVAFQFNCHPLLAL